MPVYPRFRSVSFQFIPARYLRFLFSGLDGVKSGHHCELPVHTPDGRKLTAPATI
jgi:hypothetical protein